MNEGVDAGGDPLRVARQPQLADGPHAQTFGVGDDLCQLVGFQLVHQKGDSVARLGQRIQRRQVVRRAPALETHRVEQMQMRPRLGIGEQDSPATARDGDDRGHATGQVGVGIGLLVDRREAVHQPGDQETASAVDHLDSRRQLHLAATTNPGDAPAFYQHHGIGNVVRAITALGDVDHRRTDDRQGRFSKSRQSRQGQQDRQ